MLHPEFKLVGYARTKLTDEEFRESMRRAVLEKPKPGDEEAWPQFAANLTYLPANYSEDDAGGYEWLRETLAKCDPKTKGRRLFYLATPPVAFLPIIQKLNELRLAGHGYQPPEGGWARVVIEKPFGRELSSARTLNSEVAKHFDEHEVYRIDHFLGKEAVQNLFAFRFANTIFEPVWSRTFIDHVQITAAETLGVEGRGSYYETAGALRDMVQNHLFQLLALLAIEPPSAWTSNAVRDRKVDVLSSVRRLERKEVDSFAVRGQYGPGELEGKPVPGYRQEKDVAPDTPIETYAALKLFIDNARWAGVPFYLRTGKRLASRKTELVIHFKPAAHSPFKSPESGGDLVPDLLIVIISPEEGLLLRVEGKQPGYEMRLRTVDLDYYATGDPAAKDTPSAYERLLLDALQGDPTFFARADEVEAAWEIVAPVLEHWESTKPEDFPNYPAGSEGPEAADQLLKPDGRAWHRLGRGESPKDAAHKTP
jgi:glucose-6-phosphate 1-dehydrogenase